MLRLLEPESKGHTELPCSPLVRRRTRTLHGAAIVRAGGRAAKHAGRMSTRGLRPSGIAIDPRLCVYKASVLAAASPPIAPNGAWRYHRRIEARGLSQRRSGRRARRVEARR